MTAADRTGLRSRVASSRHRIAGWASVVCLLAAVVVDALRQRDVPGTVTLGVLVAAGIVVASVVTSSSSGLALGVVALAMTWALAQDAETATGAVLVGAALAAGVVIVGRLESMPVAAAAGGQVRSVLRLLAALAAGVAVGLVLMRLVEREPLSALGALVGIGALAGLLVVLALVGGVPRPPGRGEVTGS